MPKRRTHDHVNAFFLGKPFSNVNRVLDTPSGFLGRGHRRIFHSVQQSFAVGILVTGEIKGGFAGVLHVLTDEVDSRAKIEMKQLIGKEVKKNAHKKKKTKER